MQEFHKSKKWLFLLRYFVFTIWKLECQLFLDLVDHFLSLSNPCQWLCVKYWVGWFISPYFNSIWIWWADLHKVQCTTFDLCGNLNFVTFVEKPFHKVILHSQIHSAEISKIMYVKSKIIAECLLSHSLTSVLEVL